MTLPYERIDPNERLPDRVIVPSRVREWAYMSDAEIIVYLNKLEEIIPTLKAQATERGRLPGSRQRNQERWRKARQELHLGQVRLRQRARWKRKQAEAENQD